jgi:hypothetical protein
MPSATVHCQPGGSSADGNTPPGPVAPRDVGTGGCVPVRGGRMRPQPPGQGTAQSGTRVFTMITMSTASSAPDAKNIAKTRRLKRRRM